MKLQLSLIAAALSVSLASAATTRATTQRGFSVSHARNEEALVVEALQNPSDSLTKRDEEEYSDSEWDEDDIMFRKSPSPVRMAEMLYAGVFMGLTTYVKNNKFDYERFQKAKTFLKANMEQGNELAKGKPASKRLERQLSFVPKMWDVMNQASEAMSQHKDSKVPGSAEIFNAYEIMARSMVLYNEAGIPNILAKNFNETVRSLYDACYEQNRAFHHLVDKSQAEKFQLAIKAAYQWVAPLRKQVTE